MADTLSLTTATRGTGRAGTPDTSKVTVNLPTALVEELRASADDSTTLTNLIREAIALKLFLRKRLEDDGKLLIEDPDGRVREIVFELR